MFKHGHGNKYKTFRKFCYNPPIRRSQEMKFSQIVGDDITKLMYHMFITTINNFRIISNNIFLGVEINIKQITKFTVCYDNPEVLKITIEFNNWLQFLTADKRTFKIPKGRTLTEHEKLKFQFTAKKNTELDS